MGGHGQGSIDVRVGKEVTILAGEITGLKGWLISAGDCGKGLFAHGYFVGA